MHNDLGFFVLHASSTKGGSSRKCPAGKGSMELARRASSTGGGGVTSFLCTSRAFVHSLCFRSLSDGGPRASRREITRGF